MAAVPWTIEEEDEVTSDFNYFQSSDGDSGSDIDQRSLSPVIPIQSHMSVKRKNRLD